MQKSLLRHTSNLILESNWKLLQHDVQLHDSWPEQWQRQATAHTLENYTVYHLITGRDRKNDDDKYRYSYKLWGRGWPAGIILVG